MKSLLINFSGHPLSDEAKRELESEYSHLVNSNPVEIIFDETVEAQIERLVGNLTVRIDRASSVTLIPPGQATFAILLVSYIHGLIGHFPNLCYLERSEEGLYLPKHEYKIQPQNIRVAGRKFRLANYES